jgi:hypothetical protein
MVDASTEGERFVLTGTVLRPNCQTPVAGATVDFWHCDHKGAYDIKTPDEKIAPENYRFRAITQTDKDGRFVFGTIVPGRYAIPPNLEGFEQYADQIRPAHYHITITHPIYVPLTTQIYIKGDPYIAKDPWAQHSRNVFELKSGAAVAMGALSATLLARGLRARLPSAEPGRDALRARTALAGLGRHHPQRRVRRSRGRGRHHPRQPVAGNAACVTTSVRGDIIL